MLDPDRVKAFYDFMIERESIRLRRLAGRPMAEWTADPIFQQFSFTNIKRHHDRTTTLLRQEFYDQHQADHDRIVLLNATIFRYFGCIETARLLGWSGDWNKTRRDWIQMRGLMDELRFTAAYIVPSCGRSEPKYEVVLDIIDQLWTRFDEMLGFDSWEQWARVLSSSYGCGSFMAKEILLDFIMVRLINYAHIKAETKRMPTDWETWTPVGPGARRGAARIRDGYLDRGLPEHEALATIRETYEARSTHWPTDFVTLDLTDIQFQFCEFDKFSRVAEGRRPKRNFRPTIDDVTLGSPRPVLPEVAG